MENNKEEIKFKIKNSHYFKLSGTAPEGYILIPEITLEKLKDFDNWKEWKNNPEFLLNLMISDSKKV